MAIYSGVYLHYEGTNVQCDDVHQFREITWVTDVGPDGALRYKDSSGGIHYIGSGLGASEVFWEEDGNGIIYSPETYGGAKIGPSGDNGVYIGYFRDYRDIDTETPTKLSLISTDESYEGQLGLDIISARSLWLCASDGIIVSSPEHNINLASKDIDLGASQNLKIEAWSNLTQNAGNLDINVNSTYDLSVIDSSSSSNPSIINIKSEGKGITSKVNITSTKDVLISGNANVLIKSKTINISGEGTGNSAQIQANAVNVLSTNAMQLIGGTVYIGSSGDITLAPSGIITTTKTISAGVLLVSGDGTFIGNVTAANLNIANWNTAYSISQHTNRANLDLINQNLGTTNTPTFARLTIDNIRLDESIISSTNTNGNINLEPNGTGKVTTTKAFSCNGINTNGIVTGLAGPLSLDVSGISDATNETIARIANNYNNTDANPTIAYPILQLYREGKNTITWPNIVNFGLSRYEVPVSDPSHARTQMSILLNHAGTATADIEVIRFRSDLSVYIPGTISCDGNATFGNDASSDYHTFNGAALINVRSVDDVITDAGSLKIKNNYSGYRVYTTIKLENYKTGAGSFIALAGQNNNTYNDLVFGTGGIDPANIRFRITHTGSAVFSSSVEAGGVIRRSIAAGVTDDFIKCSHGDLSNDFFRISVGGANDAAWAEIATGDNGNEPVYVRQYTGSTITRQITLLDASGNTTIPNTLTAGSLSTAGVLSAGGTTINGIIDINANANRTNLIVMTNAYGGATDNGLFHLGTYSGSAYITNNCYYNGSWNYNKSTKPSSRLGIGKDAGDWNWAHAPAGSTTFTDLFNIGSVVVQSFKPFYALNGESRFAQTSWADPHSGASYDAKFGGAGNGIAVKGLSIFFKGIEAHSASSAQSNYSAMVLNTYNNVDVNPAVAYPTLRLQREGKTGSAYPNVVTFDLARYEVSGSLARSEMWIRMTHGGTSTPDVSVMRLRSDTSIYCTGNFEASSLYARGTLTCDANATIGNHTTDRHRVYGRVGIGESDPTAYFRVNMAENVTAFSMSNAAAANTYTSDAISINMLSAQTCNLINLRCNGTDVFKVTGAGVGTVTGAFSCGSLSTTGNLTAGDTDSDGHILTGQTVLQRNTSRSALIVAATSDTTSEDIAQFVNNLNNVDTNPTTAYPVLTLIRAGKSTVTNDSSVGFGVARYEVDSSNARSELWISLSHTTSAPTTQVMRLRSDQSVYMPGALFVDGNCTIGNSQSDIHEVKGQLNISAYLEVGSNRINTSCMRVLNGNNIQFFNSSGTQSGYIYGMDSLLQLSDTRVSSLISSAAITSYGTITGGMFIADNYQSVTTNSDTFTPTRSQVRLTVGTDANIAPVAVEGYIGMFLIAGSGSLTIRLGYRNVTMTAGDSAMFWCANGKWESSY